MAPRLAEVNYTPEEGLTLRLRPHALRLLPDATRDHLRAANKELLLALRSVIDQVIERTDRQEEPSRHRRVQVRVVRETPEDSPDPQAGETSGP